MKPLLILILFTFFLSSAYAENANTSFEDIVRDAPEMIIKEEDLTFSSYKDALESLSTFFNECYKQERDSNENSKFHTIYDDKAGAVTIKVWWDKLNIGMPNCLLKVEGYGLISQREIISLRLENAKLKGVTKEERGELEQQLKGIEKQILIFLSTNTWVD